MSSYSPSIGFTPSTFDEVITRFYDLTKQYIPHTMTYDEFLESNLYLVFQGVVQLKFDDDVLMSTIINNFFNYLEENQLAIDEGDSNTYSGLYKALYSISDNVFFINYQYDQLIQPAEVVIVLENPDLTLIDDVMKDNLGISLFTTPFSTAYPPNQKRSFIIDNGQVINYEWLDADVANDDFFVKIRYRLLEGAIIPSGEIDIIKNTFLDEFNRVMLIGTKFEPERYVSTQNVDFVADFEVGYNLDNLGTYIYDTYSPALNKRLTLDLTRIETEVIS